MFREQNLDVEIEVALFYYKPFSIVQFLNHLHLFNKISNRQNTFLKLTVWKSNTYYKLHTYIMKNNWHGV